MEHRLNCDFMLSSSDILNYLNGSMINFVLKNSTHHIRVLGSINTLHFSQNGIFHFTLAFQRTPQSSMFN